MGRQNLDALLGADRKEKERSKLLKNLKKRLASSGDKMLKFVCSAAALGIVDAAHLYDYLKGPLSGVADAFAKNAPSAMQYFIPFGNPDIIYQTGLLLCNFGAAYWSFYDKNNTPKENTAGLLMGIPSAVALDYFSASIQAGTLDPFPLSPKYYLWRLGTFKHTFWYPLAAWVDKSTSLIHGAIQGYNLFIYFTAAFVVTRTIMGLYKHYKGKKTPISGKS